MHVYIHTYTYIYLLIYFVCILQYIVSYIVRIRVVYCMYMTVYTYINVFSVRKVARRIDTAIYIQNTCIHTKYIQNPESYTYIYVKIHAKYVHFFWEPVQKHPFSHCMYMNVYTVYERINQKYTYSEKIYVGNRYMYVYACICMYLHVYCCFQYTCIASTAWKLVYVCICMYMYVYVCI
jgi:hypothetical protein